MRRLAIRPALCAAVALSLSDVSARGQVSPQDELNLALPSPPEITALIGLLGPTSSRRALYLPLLAEAALREGVPLDLADAVAYVESGHDPVALGGVGEVGLMQVRPATAQMLGHRGGSEALFEPEINVRYGVAYLARAWRLAGGDLCRALMKYRAGWGEEVMSSLSVIYCRRARDYLASLGSPLANASLAGDPRRPDPVSDPRWKNSALQSQGSPAALQHGNGTFASVPTPGSRGSTVLTHANAAYQRELRLAQRQARSKTSQRSQADSDRFWAAHEARVRALTTQLRRSSGPARGTI
jgi:hypothetical protein